jgi:hypothetical protein
LPFNSIPVLSNYPTIPFGSYTSISLSSYNFFIGSSYTYS